MNERKAAVDDFLAQCGWGGAVRVTIAGDASFRRYERVSLNGKTAVLMDAPPEKEDTRPFIAVAEFLVDEGYSAPTVLGKDVARGFLLLEDLGDALFSRELAKNAAMEEEYYRAATDVLVQLQRRSHGGHAPNLAPYDAKLLLREALLFAEWYMPALLGKDEALAKEYQALWEKLAREIPALPEVPVLRDYHADNLLWLPERGGVKRVGLLDFQDAVMGSAAYDMVSFLEDARRDVSPATVERMIAHYLAETGLPREAFMQAYAMLGAQRNLKIIGIFTRLKERDGKPQYLNFLPRVFAHLRNDLQHPSLGVLKAWMEKHIPECRR